MSEFSQNSETCRIKQIMENSLEEMKDNLAQLPEVLVAISLSQEVGFRKFS